jgi:hypothetical protein
VFVNPTFPIPPPFPQMREVLEDEAEVEALLREEGALTQNMIRRHFLKRAVVMRRRQQLEMDSMHAEDVASRMVGVGWSQEWREAHELKLMAHEDAVSAEANAEWRYGAGASEGMTSEEEEGFDDDEDVGGMNAKSFVLARTTLAARRRASGTAAVGGIGREDDGGGVLVGDTEGGAAEGRQAARRARMEQQLVLQAREPLCEVLRNPFTAHIEVVVRDVQDATDRHRLMVRGDGEGGRGKVKGIVMVGLLLCAVCCELFAVRCSALRCCAVC